MHPSVEEVYDNKKSKHENILCDTDVTLFILALLSFFFFSLLIEISFVLLRSVYFLLGFYQTNICDGHI